ncbi:MAG: hypothetical protein OXE94_07985 [Aestuariivita sp.]|nr:hypothetical protein [Aestuariivita sp.]MCY4204032.1 hypothetical protein [Aestuariivita sp.]MCY4289765.1 hypothetical protein [Aestuariivita sp.]MCY4347643.1 hypothetical protein [Aestuariivita sp.]
MLLESTLEHTETPDPGFGGLNHTGFARVKVVPDEPSVRKRVRGTFQLVDQSQSDWVWSDGKFRQINALDAIDWYRIHYPYLLDREIIASLGDGETVHNSIHNTLFGEVRRVWEAVQGTFHDWDNEHVKQAFYEAIALIRSRLFSAEINPDICIDVYGEFTFSHKSPAGYVDIGVRGTGELSYHVRNDIDPTKTAFADCEWDLRSLPTSLSIAIENLQNAIRMQDSACPR